MAVSGGFIEVSEGSRVAVFAETAEFVEEIAPVLQRVAAVMEKANEAQEWKTHWRRDMERMQDELEGSAQMGLEFLERTEAALGGRAVGAAPKSAPTPGLVTRGSETCKPLKSLKGTKGRSQ